MKSLFISSLAFFSFNSLKISSVIWFIIVFVGSIASSNILWGLVDMFIAFLALINIYSMIALRKDVYLEYEKYGDR